MFIYKKYLLKYLLPFASAIICVACEAVCDLLGPTFMSKIINYGIRGGDQSEIVRWGLFMLTTTALGALFAVSRNVLASFVSQRIGEELRYDLFDKIMGVAEAEADRFEPGSLITRMTGDTSQVTQFFNGLMRIFFKAPITCIGSIILAALLNFGSA